MNGRLMGDCFISSHDCISDRIILQFTLFLQRQSLKKGLQSPFPNLYYPGVARELEENLTNTVLFFEWFPSSHSNFPSTVEFPGYRIGNTRILYNKKNYGPWSVYQVNGELKSLAQHKQLCQAWHFTETSGEGFPTWLASLWMKWIVF